MSKKKIKGQQEKEVVEAAEDVTEETVEDVEEVDEIEEEEGVRAAGTIIDTTANIGVYLHQANIRMEDIQCLIVCGKLQQCRRLKGNYEEGGQEVRVEEEVAKEDIVVVEEEEEDEDEIAEEEQLKEERGRSRRRGGRH